MTRQDGAVRPDPADEFKRSWPLDMIAPLDSETGGGPLLDHWSDLTVGDLPGPVQSVALRDPASWRAICHALIEPNMVADACDAFVEGVHLRLAERYGDRKAAISLARAGLMSDEVPTLERLGRKWDITRERVRQLVRDVAREAAASLDQCAPLRLVIGSQLALNRGTPLVVDTLARPGTARARAIELAIRTVGLPQPSVSFSSWTATDAQCRGLEALVEAMPRLLPTARSFAELEAQAATALPHIEEVLDLDATLRLLADRLDIGPGLDGRFTYGYAATHRRVAGKVVTYLERRGVPIAPMELARVVQSGVPPFEGLHRPLVEPDWLAECARRNADLLQIHPDGRIALARRLAHLRPTGRVGILHSIMVDHGEPMRMIDLCDRAAEFGMSRNQVGVLIHGGRAACLFMLDRGIVGLVGRDESADPSQYEAPRVVAKRVRAGDGIGLDGAGRIAADIEVRRSVREQGIGLPWPFSIIYLSDRPVLQVDGIPRPLVVRGNGDLDVPELDPGSRVRLRLAVTRDGHQLSIERSAADGIEEVGDHGNGSHVPVGLPPSGERPGWINFVLQGLGTKAGTPDDVLRLMPRAMSSNQRTRAFYGLVALGLLELRSPGWTQRGDRALPHELADAIASVTEDPSRYPVLPRTEQVAIGWLVRATWLMPSPGWSRVRPNDLGDPGGEEDDPSDPAIAATSPRETALMRIVEAAHHANDVRRHPGADDGVGATLTVVRRYLTALGYTAYSAVREVHIDGVHAVSVHPASDATASAIWLLVPLGAGVAVADVEQAVRIARTVGAAAAVATDGLELVAVQERTELRVDLRDIGRNQSQFDLLIPLVADAPSLGSTG